MNIGVLMGGLSKERDISLKSGKAVSKALKDAGYEKVKDIDVNEDLALKLRDLKIDVVFNALHGRYGEDGAVQGLLETMKIPYTGSGVLSSAMAMDKTVSKRLFASNGIPTPDFLIAGAQKPKEVLNRVKSAGLKWPLVIKPACEGSTIGLQISNDEEDFEGLYSEALKFDDHLIIEKFIKGRELTVGILNGEPLPLVEIVPKKGIFDYAAKYTKGLTDYYVPARVDKMISEKAQEIAGRVFELLKCSGFARVDFIMNDKKELFVFELNSIPGMTSTSLVPMAAKEAGMSFEKLVEEITLGADLKIKG